MKRLFYLMLSLALFAGCSKDSDDEPEQPKIVTLELSRDELTFEEEGGEKTFTISCNSEWTLENGSSWCKTDFPKGTGNLLITVTVDSYDGADDRNAKLTVKAGNKTQSLNIVQKAKKILLLTEDHFEVSCFGDTISVEVKSNISYEVAIPSGYQSWIKSISSRALTTKSYAFVISGNESASVREGYIVFSGNSQRDTVYITQLAGIFTETVSGVKLEMVYVKGGTFQMGATSEQGDDAYDSEKPVHSVTLSDYYIGKTEVTQGLWKAVMGSNPSYFKKGDNYPVEQVSWNDIQDFLTKLNQMTGKKYALPTEAQWEYAARGGGKSAGYKYSGSNDVDNVAWYESNSYINGSWTTSPVGTKQANELGIYDMSGNVWEWCQDWYGSSYYSNSPVTNPTGPTSGSARELRGGGWGDDAWSCRVSSRLISNLDSRISDYGFRVVLLP